MERRITEEALEQFRASLAEGERSENTIEKYLRDVRKLKDYAADAPISRSLMLEFKETLLKKGSYEVSSINSFLTALNRFFEFLGWYELKVKLYRVQRETFASEKKHLNKEEYQRLVRTARSKGNKRLAMILNSIAATGIRVSELQAFTVERVKSGKLVIFNKGKIRTVLLPKRLKTELLAYAGQAGIESGLIFCTKNKRALNRSNIWREMKALCAEAGVAAEKVFPHNLRHLFAQCFYAVKPDLAKLADVLGHGSIETTRIYIRTTGEEHLKQLERLRLVC